MISHFKTSFTVTIFFVVFLLPVLALAQEVQNYIPIVTIPGVNDNQNTDTDFGSYINALYIFAITAGALLAVLKLVGAGVKYMFSDIVTNKMEAIRDIKGALLGLLLIIGAVIILNTINTDLTRIDFTVGTLDDLPNAPPIDPRIIRISELCDDTPGCLGLRNLTEEQCSAIGGYHINNIIFADRCIVIPPDSCQPIPPNRFDCTETSCECYIPPDEDHEMREIACIGRANGILITFNCTRAEERCTQEGGTISGIIKNGSVVLCAVPITNED